MGCDKSMIVIAGEPLAARVGTRLSAVTSPTLEVGPGRSGLTVSDEPDPGEGPLPALVAGWRSLVAQGFQGPVLVLATDLPFVSVELLAWLADRPGVASVVPVVAGMPQLLCARWGAADLDRAARLCELGERSVHRAVGSDADYPDESAWVKVASSRSFCDLDEPADLERLGIVQQPGA